MKADAVDWVRRTLLDCFSGGFSASLPAVIVDEVLARVPRPNIPGQPATVKDLQPFDIIKGDGVITNDTRPDGETLILSATPFEDDPTLYLVYFTDPRGRGHGSARAEASRPVAIVGRLTRQEPS